MLSKGLSEDIAAWGRLSEAEHAERLRGCVADEVVGNKRMAGQPVSAAWEAEARAVELAAGGYTTQKDLTLGCRDAHPNFV
ncbi:hypothetical protein BJF89_10240 [Corynebacterium sp. CNJ-954]|nr:hypothetical protein BJF89_10240 [Corynebacterium sp. CNJ-954]